MTKPRSVLFIVPYPVECAPSQRFRFEQYFDILFKAGYPYQVESFLNSHNWQVFFNKGDIIQKAHALILGFLRRILMLFKVWRFDFVFIHREVAPIGPPLFEWIIAKLYRKKIIYDFDDAIWLTDKTHETRLERIIRWRNKVMSICRWSYKVSCGNEYLASFASQYNQQVIVNPTTIDTESLHNPSLHKEKENTDYVTIGWTGSHSTLIYLDYLVPTLLALQNKYLIRFVVIANKKPQLNLPFDFILWSANSEIEDLSIVDIGIMPLSDDMWAKGKCGFKALQYMALEIPAVASPVGVNTKIIKDKENGILCSSEEEWLNGLELLIKNKDLRKKMGAKGRTFVKGNYSVLSNSENFISLFS